MSTNILYTGDNLYILHGMDSETVDMIYLDPPFNSKRLYKAPVGSKAAGASFKDMWTWQDVDESYLEQLIEDFPYLVQFIQSVEVIHGKPMMAYLTYMTQRLIEMRRVLKPTGSIYLHCDPTASHYLKILMDRIFGKDKFRNEIIWYYSKWSNSSNRFQANHDVVLLYVKGKSAFFKTQYQLSDDKRRKLEKGYQINVAGGKRQLIYYNSKKIKEVDPARYDVLVDRTRANPGSPMPDVWTDINILNSQAKERVGYPTQKPLALLDRIIKASSNEGDLVLDPFCGCATTCVAAQHLHRKWVGIDISEKAAELVVDRLSDEGGLFTDFIHLDRPPVRSDLEQCEPDQDAKTRLYADQKGKCNACGVELDIWHLEIDHIIPRSKNGGDYYENYQLLCGHCNRTKGNRPMEYLRAKIKRRNETLKTKVSF